MALGRSLQLWGGATLKELFATHADLRGGGGHHLPTFLEKYKLRIFMHNITILKGSN